MRVVPAEERDARSILFVFLFCWRAYVHLPLPLQETVERTVSKWTRCNGGKRTGKYVEIYIYLYIYTYISAENGNDDGIL